MERGLHIDFPGQARGCALVGAAVDGQQSVVAHSDGIPGQLPRSAARFIDRHQFLHDQHPRSFPALQISGSECSRHVDESDRCHHLLPAGHLRQQQ